MKMEDKLNKVFNIEPVREITKESLLPAIPQSSELDKEDDYQKARSTLNDLITKNDSVIGDLIELAKNSEHPRAFEVVGQLIKTQSDIAKDLMNLHKQKQEIDGTKPDKNIKTQNNVIFAGSTADLMKMINGDKGKIIDAE